MQFRSFEEAHYQQPEKKKKKGKDKRIRNGTTKRRRRGPHKGNEAEGKQQHCLHFSFGVGKREEAGERRSNSN
jgi:hypothetical protein